MWLNVFAFWSGFVIISALQLPDGIVNIQCGSLEDNFANITYFGETEQVVAYTTSGKTCAFQENVASATWSLTVPLTGSDDTNCSMEKVSNRNIFSIKVLSRRKSSLFESVDDERFILECNFENFKDKSDNSIELEENFSTPKVIEDLESNRSNSNFSVVLFDLDDRKLTSVDIDTIVKLKVMMSPSGDGENLSFMPEECEAATADGEQTTDILVDGCGTGFPFSQSQGFQMTGTLGISPPFRMFRLHPQKGLIFRCRFITCNGDCFGSSCSAENKYHIRQKRELDDKIYTIVQTGTFNVLLEKQEPANNAKIQTGRGKPEAGTGKHPSHTTRAQMDEQEPLFQSKFSPLYEENPGNPVRTANGSHRSTILVIAQPDMETLNDVRLVVLVTSGVVIVTILGMAICVVCILRNVRQ